MSSSDSSSEHEVKGCSCRHHNEEEDSESEGENSSDYDDESGDDDDSSSDDSSDEEFINDRKHCFVGVYGEAEHYDTVIVCTATEIKKYRQKYSQLTQKNPKNIDIIWGDVKIQTPSFGKVPVKIYRVIGGEKPPVKEESKKISSASRKESTCKTASHSLKTNVNASASNLVKATDNRKGPIEAKGTSSTRISSASSAGTSQSINDTSSSSIPNKNVSNETKFVVHNTEIKKTSTTNTSLTNGISTSQIKKVSPSSVVQTKMTSNGVNSLDDMQTKKITGTAKNLTSTCSTSQTKSNAKDSSFQNKKIMADGPGVPSITTKFEATRPANGVKPNDDKKSTQSKISEISSVKSATAGANLKTLDKASKVTINNSSTQDKSSKINAIGQKNSFIIAPELSRPDVKIAVKSDVNQITKTNVVGETSISKDTSKRSGESTNDVTPVEATPKKKSKKQKRRERLLEKENSTRDSSVASTKDKSEKKNDDQSGKNIVQGKKGKSNNEKADKTQNKKLATDNSQKTLRDNEQDEDSEYSQENETDTSDDNIELNTQNLPAFIAESVKHKRKNNVHQSLPSSATSKKSETMKNNIKISREKEPVLQANKQPKAPLEKVQQTHSKDDVSHLSREVRVRLSDQCNKVAIKCILENRLVEGLFHIDNAITYCDSNLRLYLNRSYCHLRMDQNKLALSDAQHVLQETSNLGFKFMANLRAGKASLALKEYLSAERYFTDAIQTNPYSHHARRELLRAKIIHFVSKGYKERDVILAIRKCPNFWEAMKLDFDSKIPKSGSSARNIDDSYSPDDCNHLVYASDEDEKQSNMETVNQVLRYIPGKTKLVHTVARPPNVRSHPSDNVDKGMAIGGKPNTYKKVEEKSVWVGNLTNSIDETKLKNAFKKFGTVKSVYRPPNDGYAFINFESSDEVSRILNNPPPVIDGVELAVRSARHKA